MKNINLFKSYVHICEHLTGPYYRDCHVDYDDDTDSKVTHFATPRYTKPKEIGPIPTIRFQHLDLNCGLG